MSLIARRCSETPVRHDFNFSNTEFHDYFDDNPVNQFNARVLKDYPSVTYTGIPKSVSAQPTRQPRQSVRTRRAPRPVPIPVPSGTPVPPPMANTGWGAEQYV